MALRFLGQLGPSTGDPVQLAWVPLWRHPEGGRHITQAARTDDDPVCGRAPPNQLNAGRAKPKAPWRQEILPRLPRQLLLRLPPSISAPSAPESPSPFPGSEPAGAGARSTLTDDA